MLSPFTVNATRDEGFVASSSLAGGRLSTDLRDTAAAYSVQTRDFIEALDLTDLAKAADWAVNAIQVRDDGFLGEAFGTVTNVRIRGVPGAVQRDFFTATGVPVLDNFNTERFDYTRGPNALLFGTGGIGGNVSIITKHAELGRNQRQANIHAGSWDYYRATLDINQQAGDNFALRVNGVYQDAGGWQKNERDDREGVHLAAKWRINDKLELRVSGEQLKVNRYNPFDYLNDQISGWNGQSTVFSGATQGVYATPVASSGSNANQRGVQIRNNNTNSPYYVIANTRPGSIVNYGGFHRTRGGNESATVPVGGVFGTAGAGVNLSPLLHSRNVPANRLDLATAATGFRAPDRSFTAAFDGDVFVSEVRAASLFLNANPMPNLYLELAAYSLESPRVLNPASFRGNTVAIDLTQNFADGTPNPGFLRPFTEATSSNLNQENEADQFRLAGAYVFDSKKLGQFTLSAIAGRDEDTFSTTEEFFVIERETADTRFRNVREPIRYWTYLDEPSRPLNRPQSANVTVDGVTATHNTSLYIRPGSERISPTENEYFQAGLSSKLLKGRLALFNGVRRDRLEQSSRVGDRAEDLPVNYDGRTISYKPAAPADYSSLTFRERDAAGAPFGSALPADTRPRTTIGGVANSRDPRYANDRFRDDFSPPTVVTRATSYNVGGVYHVSKNVSLLANYAETFDPAPASLTLTGGLLQAASSEGWDAGVRLNFLEQRLVATIQGFEGRTIDSRIVNQSAIPTAINAFVNASPVGASGPATNTRGLVFVPGNIGDTQDLETKGIEFELTANLTKNWRLSINAASAKAQRSNAFKQARAYVSANTATFRQIAGDSGVLIGTDNVASVNPATASTALDAASVATAWNDLFSGTLLTLLTPTTQREFGSPDYTVNFYTDYRFESGFAKGARIGVGVNHRSRTAIGNRLTDTIVNPSAPGTAIDDPSVGLNDLVYRDSYSLVTVSLSRLQKINSKLSVLLDLRVENATDYADPVYTSTTLRAPGGDITSPARVTTPFQYYYVTPRRYVFRAQFRF